MNTQYHPPKVLTVFTLTMINIAAIASLRSLPLAASYGFSIISIYIVGALLFLIPSALISAELATAFHETGGIFLWVEKAFGKKIGFLAIWLQFINNVIWFPTALSFIAATVAYVINPSLVENKLFMITVIFIVFWTITLINLKGMKASSLISSIGAIFGTLIPGIMIILLGLIWWFIGKPLQITISTHDFFPSMNVGNLVFSAGVLFSFAGMEMSAVHAKEVIDPNKNYPRAIFISSVVIVILFALGALSIAFVIPKDQISLIAGLINAFSVFFAAFHISWITPVLAVLLVIGSMAQVSTWLIGPIKGIFATAEHGILPKFFDKTNRYNVPHVLVLFQGAVVSILLVVFMIMPNMNSSYWLLTALATHLYLVMYIILFAAAIYLRFTQPNLKRAYMVFGRNKTGITIVGSLGLLVCIAVLCLAFIPPEGFDSGNLFFYEGFLIIGLVVLCLIPFLIIRDHKHKKAKVSHESN